jgi:hypothetical protein
MSAVTTKTLNQSYTILALLDVCAAAASHIDSAQDIGRCLDHIKELAGQLHDTLEIAEKEGQRSKRA